MGLQVDPDLWHAGRDVDVSKIMTLKKSASGGLSRGDSG